ncbi:uncharacterized protein LOC144628376 [Oculina patagonica]
MEIHKLKIEFTVIIMFHLTAIVISEEFEIFRTKAPGFYGDRHGTDSFKIPPSLCNQGGMKCEQFGAKTEQPCFCSCPYDNATFLFHNNEWRCLDNAHVRTLLGYPNSSQYIFFENETLDDPLRLLTKYENRRITLSLLLSPCQVHVESSWLIGCNGSEPYSHNLTVFWVRETGKYFPHYTLQGYVGADTNVMMLEGRIIKLGIICHNNEYRWLLFKYVGSLECLAPNVLPTLPPTLPPIVTTKPLDSTVKPSPSKGTDPAGNSVKELIFLCGCHAFLFRLVLGI